MSELVYDSGDAHYQLRRDGGQWCIYRRPKLHESRVRQWRFYRLVDVKDRAKRDEAWQEFINYCAERGWHAVELEG